MATYHITTKEQLQAMNDDLAGDYILDNDIDLTGVTWTPIGSSATPFTGTFDGQGFTLRNLTISISEADTTDNGVGLFGTTEGCQISNLKLDGFEIDVNLAVIDVGYITTNIGTLIGKQYWSEVTSNIVNCLSNNFTIQISITTGGLFQLIDDFGGLVGMVGGMNFSKCSVSGNIIIVFDESGIVGDPLIGGLAGSLYGCEVSDCISNVDIDANFGNSKFIYGGLCGYCEFYDYSDARHIINCHATGTITADKVNCYGVGGLIGEVDTDQVVTVSGCYYEGEMTFTNSTNDGAISGLITSFYGTGTGSSRSVISECYSKVDISFSGSDEWSGIGGAFCGLESVIIHKCFSECNINISVQGGNIANVGGFFGDMYSEVEIKDCYCSGSIVASATGSSDTYAIGGFGGFCGDGSVINCYSNCIVTPTADDPLNIDKVGGFIGEQWLTVFNGPSLKPITFENCFSAGMVNLSNEFAYVGGFLGYSHITAFYISSLIIINCSWFKNICPVAVGYLLTNYDIATLAELGYGTDEPDNTKFYSKAHQVYQDSEPS